MQNVIRKHHNLNPEKYRTNSIRDEKRSNWNKWRTGHPQEDDVESLNRYNLSKKRTETKIRRRPKWRSEPFDGVEAADSVKTWNTQRWRCSRIIIASHRRKMKWTGWISNYLTSVKSSEKSLYDGSESIRPLENISEQMTDVFRSFSERKRLKIFCSCTSPMVF